MSFCFFVAGIPRSLSVGTTIRFRRTPEGPLQHVQGRRHSEWAVLVGEIGRRYAPPSPLTGPVAFRATFYVPRPRATPKRVQWPTKRPDVDSLVHKLTDQWNGVWWVDDAQIVSFAVEKRFAASRPGVQIEVQEILEGAPVGTPVAQEGRSTG